jgi:hypothetical protein
MTTIIGKAESVEFISDENGWELQIETNVGTFRFNIHGCVLDLDQSYQHTIAPYLEEGRRAAASYRPPLTQDDLDGYPLGDPKRITLEREMNR